MAHLESPAGTAEVPQLLVKRSVAAEALSVSPHTLYRMEQSGQLEAVRIAGAVRYRARDIERLAESGTSGGAAQ
jgi:predicted site-specific integrase-resolvase